MMKEILLLTLPLKQQEDIVQARQRARQIMQFLGFRAIEQTHMITAISEIARNACRYAGGGTVRYGVKEETAQFLAYIIDHGPGIANLPFILSSYSNSKGLGIKGAKKLVDCFTIHSSPQQGTMVTLGAFLPKSQEISKNLLAQLAEELMRNRPNNASEEIQQQNKELLQALDLLSKAREELEEQVNLRTKELLLSNESLRDEIEKRKETEEKIHNYGLKINEALRKSSLGEMATSLAHELNQPLAAILAFSKGCISRLKSDYRMTAEIFETLEVIAQQAERAGQVVHRIKSFTKKGQLFYEIIDINVLIEELVPLLQHDLRKHPSLKVDFKLSKRKILAEVDKIQIQQVLLNLMRNAMEALQETSTSPPTITLKTSLHRQTAVKVTITDNGPGFSEKTAEQLFETYFTTKLQGTGLGLSICRSVIEAHGGEITGNSLPEGGSCFEFILPIKKDSNE